MYYIVRTRKNQVLTTDFTWEDINRYRSKSFNDVLAVRGSLESAQTLCSWMGGSGENITSPVTPKNINKKWNVQFPTILPNSFADGVNSKKYPRCLLEKPTSRQEAELFQDALREGVSGLVKVVSEMDSLEHQKFIMSYFKDTNTVFPLPSSLTYRKDESPAPAQTEAAEISAIDDEIDDDFSDIRNNSTVLLTPNVPYTTITPVIQSVLDSVDSLLLLSDALSPLIKKDLATISDCGLKILDLEHAAELLQLDGADGYRVYKAIKNVRMQRRNAKDELLILNILSGILSSDLVKKLSDLKKSILGLDSRVYGTRSLTANDISEIIHNPNVLSLLSDNDRQDKAASQSKTA